MFISTPAQTGGSVESARPDATYTQNLSASSRNVPSPGIMVGQSALGLGLGVGGLFLGYAIDPGGMGIASGIGYMVGTSVGIWSIGAANGGKGGYLPTLLGSLGGALGGLFLSALGEEVAAPYVILGVSNLGGLAAYHISDGRLRTQVEYLERPGSRSKSNRLKAGGDLVLARW